MIKKVGLWIDHRKALIITLTNKGEEMRLVISNFEKQTRRSSESRHEGSFEPQQVPADDCRQRTGTEHLNIYYDSIIANIKGVGSILIFGPGEAKDELKKRFQQIDLGSSIVTLETADKMTDHQIVAKVKEHFAEKHSTVA
jgi:hypothetical protein